MAKGVKTGGRTKGTPNKFHKTAKESIIAVFDQLGGVASFAEWAKAEPTEFYKIYAKMLPKEMEVTGADGTPLMPTDITIRFVKPDAS